MKEKLSILATLLLFSNLLLAQNLVPNGDFESYSSLPNGYGQYYKATGWSNVNQVTTGPPYASPDYYHTSGSPLNIFGKIAPHSGSGQMGIFTYHASLGDAREYVSIQLSTALVHGHSYKLTFNLTNGISGLYPAATDNFGVHFSVNPLVQSVDEVISVTPQVEIPGIIYHSNYWQEYTFIFTVNNAANHITFGNFEDDNSTNISGGTMAYYFIDDIELISITEPTLQIHGDSTICLGDSTILNAHYGYTYAWVESSNPTTIISTDSTLKVSPIITTTYYVYGSTDTASFTVHVINPPEVNLGNDTILCQGDLLLLEAATTNASYLWQDNSINSYYKISREGKYWVEVSVYNCSASDSINVHYKPSPRISLGNDTTLCKGNVLFLNAATKDATYEWQDQSSDAHFYATESKEYWVKVTVDNCTTTDIVQLEFEECPKYFNVNLEMPNIFSPNNDGINDHFRPIKMVDIDQAKVIINNRWGQKIFESENIAEGWNGNIDGKKSLEGTYFWMIDYVGMDGKKASLSGFVTLVR